MGKTIAYRTIPLNKGAVYVFHIWKHGIMACYRRILYINNSHTSVYAHKLQTEASTGRRFIVIENRYDGRHKVYLDDIKSVKTIRRTIPDAADDTGIKTAALHNALRNIDAYTLTERYSQNKKPPLTQTTQKPSKNRYAQRRTTKDTTL